MHLDESRGSQHHLLAKTARRAEMRRLQTHRKTGVCICREGLQIVPPSLLVRDDLRHDHRGIKSSDDEFLRVDCTRRKRQRNPLFLRRIDSTLQGFVSDVAHD